MANNNVDKIREKKTGSYYYCKPEGYDSVVEKVKELCRLNSLAEPTATSGKVVERIKLSASGEYYYLKPEGFDELVDRVNEMCTLNGLTKPDMTSKASSQPSAGGDWSSSGSSSSSSGSSSSSSGSSSSGSSSSSSSGGNKIVMRSNRNNTTVTVTYIRRNDDSQQTVTAILAKRNKDYTICNDPHLRGYSYVATISDSNGNVIETLREDVEYNYKSNTSKVSLTFTEVVPNTYYLKVNGQEEKMPKFYLNHGGGSFDFVIQSNIVYNIRIYESEGDFSWFTVDGQHLDPSSQFGRTTSYEFRNCSGDKTIHFVFDQYDYVPSGIEDFGPRPEEKYSMNAYSWKPIANSGLMVRNIEVTIEVIDKKYENDVDTIFAHILQNSIYAEPERQHVDLDMSDDIWYGWLYPGGGSFTFKIKPQCYWYIYNEWEAGFGVPNFLHFSPSEGGPSDDWQTITCSWTDEIAIESAYRTILMQIRSMMTDNEICKRTWNGLEYITKTFRILPKNLITNPSGEDSSGDNQSRSYLEGSGFSVLGAFIGVNLTPYAERYPANKITIYREARELYAYVRSNINYSLERSSLPSCIREMTYMYSPNSTEGEPGQHIYKILLDENTTGSDRFIEIKFNSDDPRFTGCARIYITQRSGYLYDYDPTSSKYSLIKQANLWAFTYEYDNVYIDVISKLPYIITEKTDTVYSMNYYTEHDRNNPHSATGDEFTHLKLSNLENIPDGHYAIRVLMRVPTGSYTKGSNFEFLGLVKNNRVIKIIG